MTAHDDTEIKNTAQSFSCPDGLIYNYTQDNRVNTICPSNSSFSGLAPTRTPTILAYVSSSQSNNLSSIDTASSTPTMATTLSSQFTTVTSILGSLKTSSSSHASMTASETEPVSISSLLPSFSVSRRPVSEVTNALDPSYSTEKASVLLSTPPLSISSSYHSVYGTHSSLGQESSNALFQSSSTIINSRMPDMTVSSITDSSLTASNQLSTNVSTSIVSSATYSTPELTTSIKASKTTMIDCSSTLTSFPLIASSVPTQTTLCKCPCTSLQSSTPATETQDEIKKRLEIPKQNTGKYKRRLASAEDDRPTSVQLGCIGLAVLICTFGSILVFDILRYMKFK